MNFADIVGLTFASIEGAVKDSEEIIFTTRCGRKFRMWHQNDCCESVAVEDVVGDINDLINAPIMRAEEVSNNDEPAMGAESHTWTFYKMATLMGYVDIRWFGQSNGYYSESVDFMEIT